MDLSFGTLPPRLVTGVPGPASRALAARLRAVESRNVTYLADDFPVFWDAARGANVRDADGNVFVDLTAAFGVALAGHGAPEVVEALHAQSHRLIHGMGDVHPPVVKVRMLEALAALLPWSDTRIVLGSSGSEAVEAALKTARLASGRPGIVAFEGAYHGLTVGALAATARSEFRRPVLDRLYGGVVHLPFPRRPDAPGAAPAQHPDAVLDALDAVLEAGTPEGPVGTVVIEPVQARGGVRILPEAFGRALTERARSHGLVVVADEIYTGLGRCGAVWASPAVGLEPDVICLGKVLGGGMPISACAAPARVMDAWPPSRGEALHTSTFLGHPLSCAAAEAVLGLVAEGLPERAARLGHRLLDGLRSGLGAAVSEGAVDIRGRGLLIGVELLDARGEGRPGAGVAAAQRLLERGFLALPAGDTGSVLELSPPVVLTDEQVDHAVAAVVAVVEEGLP